MSRARPLSFYEFFAGGGMARLGLGAGWDCRFANDFAPAKTAVHRANFGGDDLREGDVWALEAGDLPGRADLAWASSPCQDFSLTGGRAGLKGGRSGAFFGFWRLIEALAAQGRAPRAVMIENVTGLLTSHAGADFTALCARPEGPETTGPSSLTRRRPSRPIFELDQKDPLAGAVLGHLQGRPPPGSPSGGPARG